MPRAPYDPATDYYGLLGLAPDASVAEIQAAYRRLAKAYHPDLNNGSALAAARMARVNRAKAILLDPQVRHAYDDARCRRFAAERLVPTPRPTPAPPRTYAAATAAPPRHYVRRTAAPGGHKDWQSYVVLAIALPLALALIAYVYDAVQVASKPTRPLPTDLALAPVSRPTADGVARAAFSIVATQTPNRRTGYSVNQFIQSSADASPEGEELRSLGRRLYQAGVTGDSEAWYRAVGELCRMAGRC